MIVIIGALVGGCSFDPVQPSRNPNARPSSTTGPAAEVPSTPTRQPPPPVTRSPSATGFSEYTAANCNGRPTAAQVIAVVRPKLQLAAGVQISVTTQPTCAGKWQYTVLGVPGHEPVHAVTKGEPSALQVVAAGTNPCIPAVRVGAPSGLRAVLGCDAVTTT